MAEHWRLGDAASDPLPADPADGTVAGVHRRAASAGRLVCRAQSACHRQRGLLAAVLPAACGAGGALAVGGSVQPLRHTRTAEPVCCGAGRVGRAQGLPARLQLSDVIAGRFARLPVRRRAVLWPLRRARRIAAGGTGRGGCQHAAGAAADDRWLDAQGGTVAAAPVVAAGTFRRAHGGQRAAFGVGCERPDLHSLADLEPDRPARTGASGRRVVCCRWHPRVAVWRLVGVARAAAEDAGGLLDGCSAGLCAIGAGVVAALAETADGGGAVAVYPCPRPGESVDVSRRR